MLFFIIIVAGVILLDGASIFLPEGFVPLLYSEEEEPEETVAEESRTEQAGKTKKTETQNAENTEKTEKANVQKKQEEGASSESKAK